MTISKQVLDPFERLAAAHRLKEPLREAVRLVLVDGITAYGASIQTGVDKSQLSKRLAKIRAADGKCPCCGHRI